MGSVYIVGVGITRLGKFLDRSVKTMTEEVVAATLADAGCDHKLIQAAWFANTRQGALEGQHGIRGQVALRPLGIEGIPIFNTDNACASSMAALNMAHAYIKGGACDIALVVGVEKMHYEGKRKEMFEAFKGSMDIELATEQLQRLINLSSDFEMPGGEVINTEDGNRSIFMDSYAAAAKYHMKKYGTTQKQLVEVAVKNHWNSQFNLYAQYTKPLAAEEVLKDKLIAWPLTRSMCAPMTDGAGAVLLCSESALKRYFNSSRAVRVLSTQVTTGIKRHPDDSDNQVGRIVARRAYEEAGVAPKDLSLVEVHDATAFGEIKQIENIGICGQGEGGVFTEQGNTRLDGVIPVNPSGGLLSKGHPIAATGAIQIHELVTQLRGEAGKRQVKGARIAAAENGGGFYDGEEAFAAMTILEKYR